MVAWHKSDAPSPDGHSAGPVMRTSAEESLMEQSLKGKNALVSGASRGIGRAIAKRLAASLPRAAWYQPLARARGRQA